MVILAGLTALPLQHQQQGISEARKGLQVPKELLVRQVHKVQKEIKELRVLKGQRGTVVLLPNQRW